MYKIVIQNEDSSTVIHNIHEEELTFWQELLQSAPIRGQVNIISTAGNSLSDPLNSEASTEEQAA